MTKKIPQTVDILPASSSSEYETQDKDSSSTDDEHSPLPQKTQQEEPQSEEESDDDSDSDDTQNSPCAFTVKPVVPESVSNSPQPKISTSKTTLTNPNPKPADLVSKYQQLKRLAEEEIETDNVDKLSQKKTKLFNEVAQSVGRVDMVSKGNQVCNGDGQSVEQVDKGKKVLVAEIEENKGLFKWSEDDENVLLGVIVDFKVNTGHVVVNSNSDAFYDHVKDFFSVNVTKTQLYDRIKRLKKKFRTNVEKWKKNGEEPVSSKPHEKELFELSHKIWGSQGTTTEGNDDKVESIKKFDKNEDGKKQLKSVANSEEVKDAVMEDNKEETQDCWSLYPLLCASLESEASGYLIQKIGDLKEYVKKMISGFGEEKARELEDGWEAIRVMDLKLYAKRGLLINKQAQAAMDSLNLA